MNNTGKVHQNNNVGLTKIYCYRLQLKLKGNHYGSNDDCTDKRAYSIEMDGDNLNTPNIREFKTKFVLYKAYMELR